MTDAEFKTWATHHATLFLMTSDADEALFAAWKPLVLPYVFQDFIDGSNYLASEKSSAFRTTHLDHIRQRIDSRRRELAVVRREMENAGQDAYCRVCSGTGQAIVPHKDYVRDMEWVPPYPTFGIYCFCSKGRQKYHALMDGIREARTSQKERVPPTPLDWDKYEALVPNWEELLKHREALKKAELKARGVAHHADLKAPLKKILGSVKALPSPTSQGGS